jgi:hypothetical protein
MLGRNRRRCSTKLICGASTAGTVGKSTFNMGDDVVRLVKAAEAMRRAKQAGRNFERIVNARRPVGIDRATGQGTHIYIVTTKCRRELVTAFPGKP